MDEKIKELESEYENLLCEKGVEMVEGYGLEGDWDSMSNEDLKSMIMMSNLQLAKMQYRIDRSKIILRKGGN